MAPKGTEQRQLFLLYQNVVLGVIVYGLGLTTMTQIRTRLHNNGTDKYGLDLTTIAQTNTD